MPHRNLLARIRSRVRIGAQLVTLHSGRNKHPIFLSREVKTELQRAGRVQATCAISGAARTVVSALVEEGDTRGGDRALVVKGVRVAGWTSVWGGMPVAVF